MLDSVQQCQPYVNYKQALFPLCASRQREEEAEENKGKGDSSHLALTV